MAKFDLSNQTAASVPTPASGNTSIFVDSSDKKIKSKDDTGTVTDYSAPGTSITSLTGDVTATGPGAAAATISNATVTGKVLTGLVPLNGTVSATDTILQAIGRLMSVDKKSWFGNGADGDATISTNTTLVRDMYYNNLTVDLGATLFANGFRVHVAGNFVLNGVIDRSGTDATGTATTAALAAGTLGASGAGGAGGTAAGTAGGAVSNAFGGSGGNGGATGSAGGTGGVATAPTAALGGVEVLNSARFASVGQVISSVIGGAGAGGGGGAGDGTAGGAGGAGGGVVVVNAKNMTGTGSITVQGGDGFQPVAGNRGGGGGGGGGAIILVTENDTTLESFTTNVSGGIGASGSGTGNPGANGSNGRVVRVRV